MTGGGACVGYDLTDSRLARLVRRADRSPFGLIAPAERGNCLAAVGFADVEFDVSFASRFVRLGTGNRRLPESLDLIRHNR